MFLCIRASARVLPLSVGLNIISLVSLPLTDTIRLCPAGDLPMVPIQDFLIAVCIIIIS